MKVVAALGIVAALAVAVAAPVVRAGDVTSATQALQPTIDGVLRVLADPALAGPARAPQSQAALRKVMEPAIDFPEAARRALAVHWALRTPPERAEFVELFKGLVMESYAAQLEGYGIVAVVLVGEAPDEELVTVHTRVENRQRPSVSVDYRMHRRDSRWLVYDVLVEGVSLVGNYRAQFHTVIRAKSYAEPSGA